MQSFFKQFQQKPSIFFVFFTGNLTLSLPVICCAGHNIDLDSNSNISKTVRVNTLFAKKMDFNKFSNNIQVDRLCICSFLVIDV